MFFGIFSFALTFTIFLQSVLGFSALQAGLTFLPLALIMSGVAPFAGRLTDRFGGRYLLMGGALMFAAGIAAVAGLASPQSTSLVAPGPAEGRSLRGMQGRVQAAGIEVGGRAAAA